MEAPGVGPVTEWVVEKDAWRVLPSPPPGAFGKRGDGTRPGAIDGVSPPLAPSQGCEQGDEVRRDDEATARGRAPSTEFPR